MIKEVKIFFFLIFSIFSLSIFAQSQTEYEKRLSYLSDNFLLKLGVDKRTVNNEAGDFKSMLYSKEVYEKLATPNGIKLLQQFFKELKTLDSYKKELDFKKEELRNERDVNKKNIKEKKLEEKYSNSDYVLYVDEVKFQFQDWIKKSEFETTKNYELRIKDSSKKVLYRIFANSFKNYIENIKQKIKIKLLRYNADNEIYLLTVNLKENEEIWSVTGVIFKISSEIAKKMKDIENENQDSRYIKVKFGEHWLINENNFVPFSCTLEFERNEFPVLLQWNPELCNEINFDSYKLGITNEKDKVVFNWDEFLINEMVSNKLEPQNKINILDTLSEPYAYPEIMPEYPGGEDALIRYLQKNIRYPNYAAENKIEGTVQVEFIINNDGSISNPRVIKGIKGGCNEEAIRLVKSMTKWSSGKQGGHSVRVYYTVPITFRLD